MNKKTPSPENSRVLTPSELVNTSHQEIADWLQKNSQLKTHREKLTDALWWFVGVLWAMLGLLLMTPLLLQIT